MISLPTPRRPLCAHRDEINIVLANHRGNRRGDITTVEKRSRGHILNRSIHNEGIQLCVSILDEVIQFRDVVGGDGRMRLGADRVCKNDRSICANACANGSAVGMVYLLAARRGPLETFHTVGYKRPPISRQ